MQYSVKKGPPQSVPTECLVVGITNSRKLSPTGLALDKSTRGLLQNAVGSSHLSGESGSAQMLIAPRGVKAKRILLIGLGKKLTMDAGTYRKAVADAVKALAHTKIKEAVFALSDIPVDGCDATWKAKQLVENIGDTVYEFDELKSKKPNKRALKRTGIYTGKDDETAVRAGVKQGKAIVAGIALAKHLGNRPGNVCTPTHLAEQATDLGKTHGLKVTILDEAKMQRLGMGSLLSVSRGSRQPAKLIVMEYAGGAKGDAPVALVGKGLTFDAGGISLKPAAKMDEMKYDMCGAASVFGALLAAVELKLPVNIVGVVPSSENLPDGDANKPGDIVTSMSGQTIEILNTDAEGRLILCDALTYTERFKPAVVIDMATLTGACVVALGAYASGLFANNDDLAQEILQAGETSGDRAWQLPLWSEYDKQLESPFADMANIGGRDAGAITAACFLARYTKKFSWAHLDIAGTAWRDSNPKGATGRPVPLLVQFLINRSANTN